MTKLQEVVRSKIEKCLKPIEKTEEENVNLATQINHYYVASRSLTQVSSERHFKILIKEW